LKQDIKKQCDDVRIEAAEEVKKSEVKLVELVSQGQERLSEIVDEHKKEVLDIIGEQKREVLDIVGEHKGEVDDCCAAVEDKSTLRDKRLEVDLVSVQREVSSLKQEILKQSTGTSTTAFLSSDMHESPFKLPVSSSFTPKVSGLNPHSSAFIPARSKETIHTQSVSNQDISQT